MLRYTISTGLGVFVPYVRANWEHEYLDDNQRLTASFVSDPNDVEFFVRTQKPDRDYANLGGGVSANFPQGWSGFFDFDSVLGNHLFDRYEFTGGVRYQF
jgi:outer membrane autotransporter protein